MALTTGKKIGTVSMIRARASIKHPPMKYTMIIRAITAYDGRLNPATQLAMSKGIRDTARK